MKQPQEYIKEAKEIISALGLPRAQQNDRSALCLLALLGLYPGLEWSEVTSPLMGITPIMSWVHQHYGIEYAPNTRETFRRQTMHQFVEAGIALYNPDDPRRPVNSPKAVYQIEPHILFLLRLFESQDWERNLADYRSIHTSLSAKYAKERKHHQIPVRISGDKEISLSPGSHSKLIKAIIEEFAPRFAPNSVLIYAGDTGKKMGYVDRKVLSTLNIQVDSHGKMPDVVLYYSEKNWLLLIEAVTSHGPVDSKRHSELADLFRNSMVPLVYVTAFPNRSTMGKYLEQIAWETEVWCADSPSHMIHFNGTKFLGPNTPIP